MIKNIGMLFFGIVILISCRHHTSQEKKGDAVKTDMQSEKTVGIPEAWINKRVTSAEKRLNSTEAGKVVWNAMEAHGGLKKWYSNGALSFRFNYQPLDGKTQRDSYQTIDTWRNRARHTSTSDSTACYGWTGDTAWIKAKDSTAFAYDTRFWALTPFYFLGQPFVLDGDGVNLDLLPPTTYKNETQEVVKVTFDPGTGDAPDDYYILYFTEGTHRLSVIRYIVSYPAYFEKGEHMPEKFMEVIGENKVDGIVLPTGYKTYWLNENGGQGEHITNIDVSNVHFEDSLDQDYFDMPSNAEVVEGL